MTLKTPSIAILFILLLPWTVPPILAFTNLPKEPKNSVVLHAKLPKFLRRKKSTEHKHQDPPIIAVGSELPNDAEVQTILATTNQGQLVTTTTTIREAVGRGTSVLVAMPLQSTKSCTCIHVPGYNEAIPSLTELGVKRICILLVSDRFLTQSRNEDDFILSTSTSTDAARIPLEQSESTPVTVLVDSEDALIQQIGITKEMGFGVRTNRLVFLLENGIVKQVLREEGVKDCTATSAIRLVEFLKPSNDPEDPFLEDIDASDAIEVDFRLVIGIGMLLTIASYEWLASFVVEHGWNIPYLPGFARDNPSPAEEVFQLLKEYL